MLPQKEKYRPIMFKEAFNSGQIMTERYYEYHHYYCPTPPLVELHQHPFYELFFFLEGDADYVIEGRNYRLRPGDILLTSHTDLHMPIIRDGKPYERIVFWLSDDFFRHLEEFYGDDLTRCFNDAASRDYRLIRPRSGDLIAMKQLCDRMMECKNSDLPGSSVLSSSYLIQFLVLVTRVYYETQDTAQTDITENSKINQVIGYITSHLTQDISVDQLAQEHYVSKYYLCRTFKSYTGITPYQYIMKKRLMLARDLLRSGVSAMDACMQCGFNDYSNFLKVFKREFEVTPKDFVTQKR